MRLLLCAIAILGCTPDCPTLATRYAAAFEDAQKCVPGQDSCTYDAPTVDLTEHNPAYYIDPCPVTCGGGNVNPNKTGPLVEALHAYREECQRTGPGPGCGTCSGERPPAYTCHPVNGGGMCAAP